jgi:hypothetical protein
MPSNLAQLEGELRALAARTVDRMLELSQRAGSRFRQGSLRPLSLARRHADPRGAARGRVPDADAHPAIVRRAGQGPFEDYFAQLAEDRRRTRPTMSPASSPMRWWTASRCRRATWRAITSSSPPPGMTPPAASTAGAMQALANDPEQWARVKADRSCCPASSRKRSAGPARCSTSCAPRPRMWSWAG